VFTNMLVTDSETQQRSASNITMQLSRTWYEKYLDMILFADLTTNILGVIN